MSTMEHTTQYAGRWLDVLRSVCSRSVRRQDGDLIHCLIKMKSKRIKLSTLRDTAVQACSDVIKDSTISTSKEETTQTRKRAHASTEGSSESSEKSKKKLVKDFTLDVIDESEVVSKDKGVSSEVVKKNIRTDTLPSKHSTDKKAVIDSSGIDDLCNDKTVYIEGLPYDSTDADVSLFFETCGEIKSIRLPKWHDSDRLRGYGHVQFATIESVKMALTLDG